MRILLCSARKKKIYLKKPKYSRYRSAIAQICVTNLLPLTIYLLLVNNTGQQIIFFCALTQTFEVPFYVKLSNHLTI